MHLGKSPKEIGLEYDTWDEIPIDIATAKKTVLLLISFPFL
jgi:hypothetical protein